VPTKRIFTFVVMVWVGLELVKGSAKVWAGKTLATTGDNSPTHVAAEAVVLL
jgi:hypothetical protein